jgi:hypothetical protein
MVNTILVIIVWINEVIMISRHPIRILFSIYDVVDRGEINLALKSGLLRLKER